ncbi:MAG: TIM barrel protein [Aggregatilineales bacterium]
MRSVQLASAPVSWGIMEETDSTHWPTWQKVLDDISQLSFQGTELGPYGFYPTDPAQLKAELDRRHLILTSAFVPIGFFEPGRQANDIKVARGVARLLKALNCPYIVLADSVRQPGDTHEPDHDAWKAAARLIETLAVEFKGIGLATVFHLEAGSHLETAAHMDLLAELTDPALIGICLDTGHHAYSLGDPRQAIAKHGKRISYVHLKDLNPQIAHRVRNEGLDFYTAVRLGIFPPIGSGSVDISGVLSDLDKIGYQGWIVVEQDTLDARDAAGRTPLEAVGISRAYLRSILGQ